VLIRADAPSVRAPRGWTDRYALESSFDRALGVREAEVERHLIVESRIGPADRPHARIDGGGGG
jgi:hypothetical protein